MNLSLAGKNAVICGSSRGIGLAIAKELALLGANCTLMARDETILAEAVKSLDSSAGQSHEYMVVDFAHATAVKKSIDMHVANETVHILVNNSGGPPAGPITEADPGRYREELDVVVEVEGLDRPAVAARWLTMYIL